MRTSFKRAIRSAQTALVVALLAFSMSQVFAATGQPGDVDLSPTPPDLDASVDPNIVVSFDDSGSMASNFMGDNRPFDNALWSAATTNPWRCAGRIGKAGHISAVEPDFAAVDAIEPGDQMQQRALAGAGFA